ncbi:MAG: hypothetical protein R2733_16010 [Acidimicrobiales bacterium]
MAESFDVDAMIERYRQRAEAVKKRNLPPVGGDERKAFIQQAEQDFMDYAVIADAKGELEGGILTLTIDMRPPSE